VNIVTTDFNPLKTQLNPIEGEAMNFIRSWYKYAPCLQHSKTLCFLSPDQDPVLQNDSSLQALDETLAEA
jgi:hypothetical protein